MGCDTRTITGICALLFWAHTGLSAQANLIPNPGFEAYRKCPRHLGNFGEDLSIWTIPTLGSTDFFHRCSDHMGTPENFNGTQKSFEGEGYAGFYAYAPGDYREYLQTPLRAPLREGATYTLSFYVSLAERSDYAIRDFGALFSQAPLSFPIKKNLSRGQWYSLPENAYHYLELSGPGHFSDAEGWVRVEARFRARGTERYLILGNFRTNRETSIRPTRRRSNKGAYYYIDLVELRGQGGEGEPREAFALDSLQAFRSLLFEFDTYRLTDTGKEELQALVDFLLPDPTLHLFLAGHTDIRGTAPYNQRLSEMRCRAVAEYLQGMGLPPDRIRWRGYGATRPVAGNDTESGRQRNRRVEFLIRREAGGDPELEK